MDIYLAKTGESLYAIARRFGTTVDRLVRLNNLDAPDDINTGQQQLVPAAISGVVTGGAVGMTCQVDRTFSTITVNVCAIS